MTTAQTKTLDYQLDPQAHQVLIDLASRYYLAAVEEVLPQEIMDQDVGIIDLQDQTNAGSDIDLQLTDNKRYQELTQLPPSQLLKQAYDLAVEAFEKDPSHLPGINLLARIELQRQRIQAAQHWIDIGLRLKPDSASLLYSAGHIALAGGSLEQAEQRFFAAKKISRVSTKSSLYLAHVKLLKGDYKVAFELYRELAKTLSHDPQVRNKLVEAASHVEADGYSTELEQDLLRFLEFEDVDHAGLRSLTTSLLKHKLQLSEVGCPLEFEQLISDPLLQSALQKFYFTDPIVEQLLLTLRRSILVNSSQTLAVDQNTMPIVIALAIQNTLNESVWVETDQELQILDSLMTLAQQIFDIPQTENNDGPAQAGMTAEDIYPLMVLIALYRPLSSMDWFEQLVKIAPNRQDWPIELECLIELTVEQPQQLQYWAQQIPRVLVSQQEQALDLQPSNSAIRLNDQTTADNQDSFASVSARVTQQYDQYPYPRWTSLGYQQKSDYHQTLRALFPSSLANLKAPAQGFEILVAGCGTGRHAISLARYFENCHVTAIDLSRQALAYAQYQAERYGLKNIQFMQGDILRLDQWSASFDIIETSGVLHHMASPQAGLQSLMRHLKPGGLIKIGLYSAQGRRAISQFRQLLNDQQGAETCDVRDAQDIRHLRSALIHQQIPGDWQTLITSNDFYSLSACKDLLFHEQEHVFDHTSLTALIDESDCEWVGMVPPGMMADISLFKSDPSSQDRRHYPQTLDEWCQLEQEYPDLFAGMYQFYCRRPFPSGMTEISR